MPRGMFSYPLVDALMIAKTLQAVQQGRAREAQAAIQPDPTSQRFEEEAAASGQMVGQLPRAGWGEGGGLFSTPGMFLHLLPRTVEARPKDILAEQAALGAQQTQKAQTMKDIEGLFTSMGSENAKKLMSTPEGQKLLMFATGQGMGGAGGVSDISALGLGPTPKEQAATATQQYKEAQEDIARQRLRAYQEYLDLRKREAARLEAVPPIGTRERLRWDAVDSGAKRAASDAAAARLAMSSWDDYMLKNKQSGFVMKDDLSDIDKKVYKTPRMALNDPNVLAYSNARTKQTIDGMRANIDSIDQLEKLAPKLFPDYKDTASTQEKFNTAMRWKAQQSLTGRFGQAYRLWGQQKAVVLQYIRDIQQRYGTAAEIQGIGEGSFPVVPGMASITDPGDSLNTAMNKLESAKRRLRQSLGATTARDEATFKGISADAEYNAYMYGDHSEEPAPSPLEPPPAGMPDAPSEPADSGEAP